MDQGDEDEPADPWRQDEIDSYNEAMEKEDRMVTEEEQEAIEEACFDVMEGSAIYDVEKASQEETAAFLENFANECMSRANTIRQEMREVGS